MEIEWRTRPVIQGMEITREWSEVGRMGEKSMIPRFCQLHIAVMT